MFWLRDQMFHLDTNYRTEKYEKDSFVSNGWIKKKPT